MPSVSKAQREAIAIAEHHPDELYPENAGLKKMTHQQQHDFAATKEKGLPEHVKHPKHPEKPKGPEGRAAKEFHHGHGRHKHGRGEGSY